MSIDPVSPALVWWAGILFGLAAVQRKVLNDLSSIVWDKFGGSASLLLLDVYGAAASECFCVFECCSLGMFLNV